MGIGRGSRVTSRIGLVLALTAAAAAPATGQTYRAALHLAAGPLFFTLRLDATHAARLCTGPDCFPATWRRDGDSLRLAIPAYDAIMVAADRGDSLDGYYHNIGRLGPRTIPFSAERRPEEMVRRPGRGEFLGDWNATLVTDGRGSPRVFAITQGSEGLEAAVLSNTGDYGRFTGRVEGDSVRFSHFDGSFVYMFTARLDGDTLRGSFNAGLRTRTPFTAVRGTGAPFLTPPEAMTQADTAPFRFSFPSVDGGIVTQDDPRFRGRVVIVDLFGTWCPTCHDAAVALKTLYAKYHDRGLEIVGIGYEVAGDTAIDGATVRRFRDSLDLPWPLLLAGLPNSATQDASQPQLTHFTAYPTTLFLGRDGRIRRVHAGFYGPATGTAHLALLRSFDQEVARLLAE